MDGHEKRGRYVGSHLHLNVTYLAVASPEEPLRVKPDENSGVRWVDLDDVCTVSTEPLDRGPHLPQAYREAGRRRALTGRDPPGRTERGMIAGAYSPPPPPANR